MCFFYVVYAFFVMRIGAWFGLVSVGNGNRDDARVLGGCLCLWVGRGRLLYFVFLFILGGKIEVGVV